MEIGKNVCAKLCMIVDKKEKSKDPALYKIKTGVSVEHPPERRAENQSTE
jgi:hypothetical protein